MKNVLIFGSILVGLALFLGPTIINEYFKKVQPQQTEVSTSDIASDTPAPDQKKRQVVYRCADEKKFLAEFQGTTVQIQLPDGRVSTLKEYKIDGGGMWFKEDTSDLYMFVKGYSGFVTDDGEDVYARCVVSA